MAGHQIDNPTRTKLEKLFDMSGGYVLDFSNASFAAFVETCLGFDPYDRYDGSKAAILRKIWISEPWPDVARLNRELLEHWHLEKLAGDVELTPFEARAYEGLSAAFAENESTVSADTLTFLERDLSKLDLRSLPVELTAEKIVRARLDEIERCMSSDAPLAVIFLVGSTLEGLLMELALANAATFSASSSAPKVRGKTKPVGEWTLAELIAVSRSLGFVGEDVLKHADHVRNFRNYIHPRQQMHENFEPRMMTAQIARQVLLAALGDLNSLAER
ncbi:MAG: hypothetical protein R8G01_08900 [Ilumatobacteraceae bacterium]|nr:hypothetical protein [Ilumatobacteraceae bacterium]